MKEDIRKIYGWERLEEHLIQDYGLNFSIAESVYVSTSQANLVCTKVFLYLAF